MNYIKENLSSVFLFLLFFVIVGILVFVLGIFSQKTYFQSAQESSINNNSLNSEKVENKDEKNLSYEQIFKECTENPVENFMTEEKLTKYDFMYYATMEALASRDIKICNSFSGDFDNIASCRDMYYMITSNLNKEDSCSSIVDYDLRNFCIASVSDYLSGCDKIKSETQVNICKASVSLSDKYCLGLTPEYKGQCQDNILIAKAFDKKDVKICDSVGNSTLNGRFNFAYCKIALSDSPKEMWNDIYTESVCYEKYAKDLANEKGDVTICEKIPYKDFDNKKLYADCLGQF